MYNILDLLGPIILVPTHDSWRRCETHTLRDLPVVTKSVGIAPWSLENSDGYYRKRNAHVGYTKSILNGMEGFNAYTTRTNLILDVGNDHEHNLLCIVDKYVFLERGEIYVNTDIRASVDNVKRFLSLHDLDVSGFSVSLPEAFRMADIVADSAFLSDVHNLDHRAVYLLSNIRKNIKDVQSCGIIRVHEFVSDVTRDINVIIDHGIGTCGMPINDVYIPKSRRASSRVISANRGCVDQLFYPSVALDTSYISSLLGVISTVGDAITAYVCGNDTRRIQITHWSVFDQRIASRLELDAELRADVLHHDMDIISSLCDEIGDMSNVFDVVHDYKHGRGTTVGEFGYIVEVLPDARVIVTPVIKDSNSGLPDGLVAFCTPYSSFTVDAAYIAAFSPTFAHGASHGHR